MKAALLKVFRALPFAFLALVLTANAAVLVGDMGGCGASQSQNGMKAALVTTNTARAAFLTYDAQHQADIVKAATSQADGHAKLLAYRKDRDAITSAMIDSFYAIAVAAASDSTDAEIAAAKKTVANLLAALAAIGVKL